MEKRDFDTAAATWDEKPQRIKLAGDVAEAIRKEVKITSSMDVADFGCGTGLLSFLLQPMARSLTGIDSSVGMLEVFREKGRQFALQNIRTQLADLDRGDILTGRYDLVVSTMTLHHVRNVSAVLDQLHGVLAPGGSLCVADLDPDGGLFHEDNSGVFHCGFEREALRRSFADAGFVDIRDTTASEIVKPDKDGDIRRFTVFLMAGRKMGG